MRDNFILLLMLVIMLKLLKLLKPLKINSSKVVCSSFMWLIFFMNNCNINVNSVEKHWFFVLNQLVECKITSKNQI